jgi:hypothetical protein
LCLGELDLDRGFCLEPNPKTLADAAAESVDRERLEHAESMPPHG